MSATAYEFSAVVRVLTRLYGKLSAKRKRQLLFVLLISIFGGFAEVATIGLIVPFLTVLTAPDLTAHTPVLGQVFEVLGAENRTDQIFWLTVLFCSVALVAGLVRIALVWSYQHAVYWIGYDLAGQAYNNVLSQPYRFHLDNNSSTMIAGLEKVQTAVNWILMPVVQAITSVIISLFIITALLLIDPIILILAALAFASVYGLINLATRRRLVANSSIIAKAQTDRVKAIQEGIGGIRDVIIDRAQPQFLSVFQVVDYGCRKAQVFNSLVAQLPRFAIEAFGMILFGIVAYYFTLQSGGLVATLPVLAALALGAQRLLPLFQAIYQALAQVWSHLDIVIDVLKLLDLKSDNHAVPDDQSKRLKFDSGIKLKNVDFSYSGSGVPVVETLNLSIKKGERVAFIGRTGSGKSTIMDLLMGLLSPTGGQISVDGVELAGEKRAGWQKHIAHVPQAIFLADATLAENIAFGIDPASIDMDRVKRAAEGANIAEFVEGLPTKYQTTVGERGVRLSGGQRQRIGIARALYKDADVLVFDEATSALDSETEASVMQAIEGLGRSLTIFIIAHRVTTVRFCDRIVRLERGKVVAEGSYEAVVDAPEPA
ncbi:MAG: ABC transporter ATP-binding protein [Pseudomonadota bacterium]